MVVDYKDEFTFKFKDKATNIGLGLPSTLLSCGHEESGQVESPNILFIIADDQGGLWLDIELNERKMR